MVQVDTKARADDLVIGLVGAIGVDLETVYQELSRQLRAVCYRPSLIRLSETLREYAPELGVKVPESFYGRALAMMEAGNKLRAKSGHNDVLALFGIALIINESSKNRSRKNAFIVRQLKRPEEVLKFREVYGDRFVLISCHKSLRDRRKYLKDEIRNNPENIEEISIAYDRSSFLIKKDEMDSDHLNGQKLEDTFPLADFILDAKSHKSISDDSKRIIEMLFGKPYESPNRDEQGMYFSYAASLRSLDLSRQVGAAVFNDSGDILAIGCNEVPKAGGGQYWCDDPGDMRDFQRGSDPNVLAKIEMVRELLVSLKKNGWLSELYSSKSDAEILESSLNGEDAPLREMAVMDLLEFGRIVHAEMAAITDASKRGISLLGSTLYTTTFPCHMCTHHIISSGIKRVVYIEPYPKSKAFELHGDAIASESSEYLLDKVAFQHFKGVTPQRYQHFFHHPHKRKQKSGKKIEWSPEKSTFKYSNVMPFFLQFEVDSLLLLKKIESALKASDIKKKVTTAPAASPPGRAAASRARRRKAPSDRT